MVLQESSWPLVLASASLDSFCVSAVHTDIVGQLDPIMETKLVKPPL